MGFVEEYFLSPIYSYQGYNLVNTTVYAVAALAFLYLIYVLFKRASVPVGESFFKGVVAFTLFGSSKRVVTDMVDGGLLSGGLWELYSYNIWNVSPTIYVVVALLFLLFYLLEVRLGRRGLAYRAGMALALPHLLPILLHITHWWILPAAFVPSLILYAAARYYFNNPWLAFPVGSHALDGVASVLAITLLSYGEQHVLANLLIGIHPWLFPITKVVVAFLFSHFLRSEKDPHLYWILLSAATVMGLAPGFRNVLRAAVGV